MFDLSIRGSEFTWWNKQVTSPIAKKLDRILINDLWQLKFPTSFAHFGSPDFSDHSPSCLILGDRVKTKKQFMVSHFLFYHPDFLPRIAMQWQEMHVIGSAMYSLSLKLKLLKKEIMDINREHFSDLEERVKEAHSHLVSYQNQLMADPTPLLASCEKEAHKKWVTLALAEERFLEQRSRVNWLENEDTNTPVFHIIVVSRRALNQIHYLIDVGGNRLSSILDIKSHCVSFYEDLFGAETQPLPLASLDQITEPTSFRCSDSMKALLQAPVTAEDVKREIFSLPRNKTPGPDGYTGEFYKKTWDVIGLDLTRAVLEFFKSGKLRSNGTVPSYL